VKCDWDPDKYERNLQRHNLRFELAEEAFEDSDALTFNDYIDETGEQRYQTIASVQGVLVQIAHVYRVVDGEERPRIISLRKAVRYEQTLYLRRR
jgi:uncharacterized DUF497 family protein